VEGGEARARAKRKRDSAQPQEKDEASKETAKRRRKRLIRPADTLRRTDEPLRQRLLGFHATLLCVEGIFGCGCDALSFFV